MNHSSSDEAPSRAAPERLRRPTAGASDGPRRPLRLAGSLLGRVFTGAALLGVLPAATAAQQHLPDMPRFERFAELAPRIGQSVDRRALRVEWSQDGSAFEYVEDGVRHRYEVATGRTVELGEAESEGGRRGRRGPARGRQFTEAVSPDSSRTAFYRDRNLYIRGPEGEETAVTTRGSEADRTKFGTASWVYGEELDQRTAMWWSPDGSMLAYYGFDETPVQDYYLQMDQTEIQSTLDVEAYPKAGTDNPVVELYVYDLDTGESRRLAVRDGLPFTDDVVGHYVYGIEWAPDGEELIVHRTNRRQNVMELAACDPADGECRVVVREEWPASWTENTPTMRWLEDGERFLWMSERTGFRNLYLYDLDEGLLTSVTDHPFEVQDIALVDEELGEVWYTARSGDNHMKFQLHRVGLDGTGDVRLTDPAFNHGIQLAPAGGHFVDVAETHDIPPTTYLRDRDGTEVAVLAESDMTGFRELGLEPVELFEFTAADGETTLHGMLHKPSDFDPSRSYPVLVGVYAGPATNGASERFQTPHPYTELGFLVVRMDSRSAAGRGKRFLDAIYEKLGTVEVDDQAEGIRTLRERSYVDGERVGIYGTSYGGYVSIMAILRHPDVFQAASASSPVTDWRHYDTIYTERYMWTPQGNRSGYDAGSAMTYVDELEGDLMLYYGTADNNVHPSNMMQLIAALQEAGKSFEVQVGPDRGHSSIGSERMLEFLIEHLVMYPPAGAATASAGR